MPISTVLGTFGREVARWKDSFASDFRGEYRIGRGEVVPDRGEERLRGICLEWRAGIMHSCASPIRLIRGRLKLKSSIFNEHDYNKNDG